MGNTIKINTIVVVNPFLIFRRIDIYKNSDKDLHNFLMYELAPFPLAVFNNSMMGKTKKTVLYIVFPV